MKHYTTSKERIDLVKSELSQSLQQIAYLEDDSSRLRFLIASIAWSLTTLEGKKPNYPEHYRIRHEIEEGCLQAIYNKADQRANARKGESYK